MEVLQKDVGDVENVVNLYNKIIDQTVPAQAVRDAFQKLNEFQRKYSNESALLMGDIQLKIMAGMDKCFIESELIKESTSLAKPLLKIFISLFTNYNPKEVQSQKELLRKELSSGDAQMVTAQNALRAYSKDLNSVSGQLKTFQYRLKAEYDDKSSFLQSLIIEMRGKGTLYETIFGIFGIVAAKSVELLFLPQLEEKLVSIGIYFSELNGQISQTFCKIDIAKQKLDKKVQRIGELKVKIELAIKYVNVDVEPKFYDVVVKTAQNLIDGIEKFHQLNENQSMEIQQANGTKVNSTNNTIWNPIHII